MTSYPPILKLIRSSKNRGIIYTPTHHKMDYNEQFLFYQPYTVNNYIENYLQNTSGVVLKQVSMKHIDTPDPLPIKTEITSYEAITIEKYSMIYEYSWFINHIECSVEITITETHERDKYTPVDSSGYFKTNIHIMIASVGKYTSVIYKHMNYLMDTLKEKETRETDQQYMKINTQLSYTEMVSPTSI